METSDVKKAKSFITIYKTQSFPAIEAFLKKNSLVDNRKAYQLSQFKLSRKDAKNVEIDIPKLTITSDHMSALRNIRPVNSKVDSIDLGMKFGIKDDKVFSDATFLIKSKDTKTKYCSFHFDTLHPTGNGSNRFLHPVYHFQFGGENLSSFGFGKDESYYGRLLFLDTPRIANPPMDLSLALHFIFTNFLPYDKYLIKDSPEFEGLVKKAQSYLWGPFYKSISAHWSNPTNSQFAKSYLPQIVG